MREGTGQGGGGGRRTAGTGRLPLGDTQDFSDRVIERERRPAVDGMVRGAYLHTTIVP